MKLRSPATTIGFALLCVVIGYLTCVAHLRNFAHTGAGDLDMAQSFSETENAKEVLMEERSRFLRDWYPRFRAEFPDLADKAVAEDLEAPFTAGQLIEELEAKMDEFHGTTEELTLQKLLLKALYRSGRHERWLDAYLNFLYTDPGNEAVVRWVQRAIDIGRATGREAEMMEALWHWNNIPDGYAGKTTGAGSTFELAANFRHQAVPDAGALNLEGPD